MMMTGCGPVVWQITDEWMSCNFSVSYLQRQDIRFKLKLHTVGTSLVTKVNSSSKQMTDNMQNQRPFKCRVWNREGLQSNLWIEEDETLSNRNLLSLPVSSSFPLVVSPETRTDFQQSRHAPTHCCYRSSGPTRREEIADVRRTDEVNFIGRWMVDTRRKYSLPKGLSRSHVLGISKTEDMGSCRSTWIAPGVWKPSNNVTQCERCI
jgi:hypothetical protein